MTRKDIVGLLPIPAFFARFIINKIISIHPFIFHLASLSQLFILSSDFRFMKRVLSFYVTPRFLKRLGILFWMPRYNENYSMMMESHVAIVPYSPPLLVTRMPMSRPSLSRPPRPLTSETQTHCPRVSRGRAPCRSRG